MSTEDLAPDGQEWLSRAYQAHADAVYRLARMIVRDAEDAADCVQVVFERALVRRHTYDPLRPLRPWLLGICSRECLQLRRRLLTRARVAASLRPPEPGDPESSVVWQAIAGLSPHHRAVVGLFHVHGYSLEECGSILDVPPGTVASRLHAARRRLRAALRSDELAEVGATP